MQNAFLEFIKTHDLIAGGEKVLLGVSGGIDSVVMLHLFMKVSNEIAVAHCNFKLRGTESDGDEAFVRNICEDLDIPCHVERFKTEEYASKEGISIQMAARELRISWFKTLLADGFDKLALAHHKDDQLETIIFNLAKGTGISGLTGYQPKVNNTIRPLLFADRDMIKEYAVLNSLKWREDSSNETTKYSRNLIRHKIIPVLKEINPGINKTMDYTLLRLLETEMNLDRNLLDFANEAARAEGRDIYISKSRLRESLFPTVALFGILERYGFNYVQVVNIFESIDGVGKLFFSEKGFVLNVDRDEIILSPMDGTSSESIIYEIEQGDRTVELYKSNLSIDQFTHTKGTKIPDSKTIAFLDFDKLKFPLKIRHWSAGDWFIPLGMKGKKKISDLMIDEKIPLNLKNRVLVLESAGDVVWVVGHRIDDRYKITSSTTRIWKAEYEKD